MSERTSGSRVGERGRQTPGKRDEDRGVVCGRRASGESLRAATDATSEIFKDSCLRSLEGEDEGIAHFGAMTLKLP